MGILLAWALESGAVARADGRRPVKGEPGMLPGELLPCDARRDRSKADEPAQDFPPQGLRKPRRLVDGRHLARLELQARPSQEPCLLTAKESPAQCYTHPSRKCEQL